MVSTFWKAEAATRKTRRELLKEIDPEYYGYLDEDEYLLLEQEEKCEKEGLKKMENFFLIISHNFLFYLFKLFSSSKKDRRV